MEGQRAEVVGSSLKGLFLCGSAGVEAGLDVGEGEPIEQVREREAGGGGEGSEVEGALEEQIEEASILGCEGGRDG